MKKINSLRLATLCMALFFSPTVTLAFETDLFVEPLLGYDTGSFETNASLSVLGATENIKGSGTVSGVGLGARGGLIFDQTVFLGPDLRYGFMSLTDFKTYSTSDPVGEQSRDSDIRMLSAGAVAGVKIPALPVRGWVGYAPYHRYDGDDFNLTGSSWRVGAGALLFGILAVNAEYSSTSFSSLVDQDGSKTRFPIQENLTFDEESLGSFKVDKPTAKTFLFSLSLPLSTDIF